MIIFRIMILCKILNRYLLWIKHIRQVFSNMFWGILIKWDYNVVFHILVRIDSRDSYFPVKFKLKSMFILINLHNNIITTYTFNVRYCYNMCIIVYIMFMSKVNTTNCSKANCIQYTLCNHYLKCCYYYLF